MSNGNDLDGKYTVTTHTTYEGPHQKQGDGFTIIKGGKTLRLDETGCEWHSTFEWAGEGQVKMTSVVDPTYAADGFKLLDSEGRATSQAQTYETILVAGDKNGQFQMSGTIMNGAEKVTLIMRRVTAA